MYDLGFFLSLFSHKKRVIIDESCFDLISFFSCFDLDYHSIFFNLQHNILRSNLYTTLDRRYFVTKIVLTYCKKKLFSWSRKTFEIRGWRPRICKNFEIMRTIYSNIVLATECFFNFSWRFLISNGPRGVVPWVCF